MQIEVVVSPMTARSILVVLAGAWGFAEFNSDRSIDVLSRIIVPSTE